MTDDIETDQKRKEKTCFASLQPFAMQLRKKGKNQQRKKIPENCILAGNEKEHSMIEKKAIYREILEGTARYAGLLLAPAKDSPFDHGFFALRAKKELFTLF